MDNNDLSLCIKQKKGYKNLNKNLSDLKDYDNILQEVIKLNEEKESKPFEININHPEEGTIKIVDKEEWDILYNYNIINECLKSSKLKINPNKIKKKEINKKKSENLPKIISYIIKKFSQDFCSNMLFKFLSNNKEIVEAFIFFIKEELKKSNINEIEKNYDIKKIEIKENMLELIKNAEIKGKNINYHNSINNLNDEILVENTKMSDVLHDIKEILKDIEEEKNIEEKNIEEKKFRHSVSEEQNLNINNSEKSEEETISSTFFKININKDIDSYFGDDNFLKKLKEEEYLEDIEIIKNEFYEKFNIY